MTGIHNIIWHALPGLNNWSNMKWLVRQVYRIQIYTNPNFRTCFLASPLLSRKISPLLSQCLCGGLRTVISMSMWRTTYCYLNVYGEDYGLCSFGHWIDCCDRLRGATFHHVCAHLWKDAYWKWVKHLFQLLGLNSVGIWRMGGL